MNRLEAIQFAQDLWSGLHGTRPQREDHKRKNTTDAKIIEIHRRVHSEVKNREFDW